MSGLRRRLERLEGDHRPCSRCGASPGEKPEYDYEVIWCDLDGRPVNGEPEPEPERCPECQRELTIIVEWENDLPLQQQPLDPPVPDYPPSDWRETHEDHH